LLFLFVILAEDLHLASRLSLLAFAFAFALSLDQQKTVILSEGRSPQPKDLPPCPHPNSPQNLPTPEFAFASLVVLLAEHLLLAERKRGISASAARPQAHPPPPAIAFINSRLLRRFLPINIHPILPPAHRIIVSTNDSETVTLN